MANPSAWVKRGFSAENIAQIVVSILVGFGIPAMIRWFGHAHTSTGSLVVLGLGSGLFVFGLLLIVRAARAVKPADTDAITEVVTAAVKEALRDNEASSYAIPVGAQRLDTGWYVQHEPVAGLDPPYRIVILSVGTTLQGAKRIACEVADPGWDSHIYRFWDPEVAWYHLPARTWVTRYFPNDFPDATKGSDGGFSLNGNYEVRWWAVDESGERTLIATDGFEVRDGGLVA